MKINYGHIIINFDHLASSALRRQALLVAEAGYSAINTTAVVQRQVRLDGKKQRLEVCGQKFELKNFRKIICLGFGKAAPEAVSALSHILNGKLSSGYVIGLQEGGLPPNITSRVGTHPHPSALNIKFTKELVQAAEDLAAEDLVICVVSGGGSSLLTWPYDLSAEELSTLFKALTRQGATIAEINTVRKHLDRVKGGGLAKLLYPATVISLIFSDVPGDDLSSIASGPTVKDKTTIRDASAILSKYQILEQLDLPKLKLYETPKEDKYFARVHNVLAVSGKTALAAMKIKAEDLGFKPRIFSAQFQGQARELAGEIIDQTKKGECLLGAGESTVKITGKGLGGRNQEMALAALASIGPNQVLACLASDGHDNTEAAGAIVDFSTKIRAQAFGLNHQTFLDNNDSFGFFEQTGDAVLTGLTGSNVSDFFVSLKI